MSRKQYIYRVQVEGKLMRQVEIESDVPLSDASITDQSLAQFKRDWFGNSFDEVSVSFESTTPSEVEELAEQLKHGGYEMCPRCKINSVYDGCCIQCMRPPGFYKRSNDNDTEVPA